MESLIRDDVTKYLEVNKLLRNSQHSFMKGRSCATHLLDFLEGATTVVDGGGNLNIIYMDFAKAFLKVPKQRLMKKSTDTSTRNTRPGAGLDKRVAV